MKFLKVKQRGDIEVTFTITMSIIILVIVSMISNWSCKSKWEYSGFKVTWGPVQGCMLERKDGTRVPADSMRNLD